MGYFIEIDPAFALRSLPHSEPASAKRRIPHRPHRGHTRAILTAEFRAWQASLPTPLERDTLLMPDVIAETVVAKAEGFLRADLPAGWAERLAARAHHLYSCHEHFKKSLNRPRDYGRDILHAYMRHWTAGWLKREQNPLFKALPAEYCLGRPVPKRGD